VEYRSNAERSLDAQILMLIPQSAIA
jgi:hypothetical protein